MRAHSLRCQECACKLWSNIRVLDLPTFRPLLYGMSGLILAVPGWTTGCSAGWAGRWIAEWLGGCAAAGMGGWVGGWTGWLGG